MGSITSIVSSFSISEDENELRNGVAMRDEKEEKIREDGRQKEEELKKNAEKRQEEISLKSQMKELEHQIKLLKSDCKKKEEKLADAMDREKQIIRKLQNRVDILERRERGHQADIREERKKREKKEKLEREIREKIALEEQIRKEMAENSK